MATETKDEDEGHETTSVVDVGSSYIRVGWADGEELNVFEPSLVGRAKRRGTCTPGQAELYFPPDAIVKRGLLISTYPIVRGRVQDGVDPQVDEFLQTNAGQRASVDRRQLTGWELMEAMWEKFCPKVPTLLVDEPLSPAATRARKAEIFFEKLQVPRFFMKDSASLTCYSMGRLTGCVLSSGGGVSYAAAVYDGQTLPQSFRRADLAGCDLDARMVQLLREQGYADNFTTPTECAVFSACARVIKEELSFLALDYEAALSGANVDLEKEYELPDCTVIKVGSARFKCPELLFQQEGGIADLTHRSVNACDFDANLVKECYANILCAGGSTNIDGLDARLVKELTALAPAGTEVKVVAAPQDPVSGAPFRSVAPWFGASILTAVSSFESTWVTKEEFDDAGPQIFAKKG